jgi:hypothetical protein
LLELSLEVFVELLLLEQLLRVHLNPVFDSVDVDSFRAVLSFLVSLATFLFIASFLLKALELSHLLLDKLISLLQVDLELANSLFFLLVSLLGRGEILVDSSLEFAETLIPVLLLLLHLFRLLLLPRDFVLHGLEAGFLLDDGLGDALFLLFLVLLLFLQLLVECLHLLLVLLLDGYVELDVLRLFSSHHAHPSISLRLGHAAFNLLNLRLPSVLKKRCQV